MWGTIVILLLTSDTAAAIPAVNSVGASYQSKKTLPALERCLTDNLMIRGDVTAVATKDNTTLVYREDVGSPPMLVELAPPAVNVTTKFAYGTKHLIEGCL